MKNVIVFGASTNPERYAYKASVEFKAKGYNVFPVGRKRGIDTRHGDFGRTSYGPAH